MAIQTKDDAQGKADRRVDRSFFKKTKEKPPKLNCQVKVSILNFLQVS